MYFNNPVDYLSNLSDPEVIEAIGRNHIILTMGEHDPCREANLHLSGLLAARGIEHTLDVIPGAFGHDWPWWREQNKKHIA